MENFSQLIGTYVETYGYLLVFVVVFLDQAAISIPSPPFVTAIGILASGGRFNLFTAFLVVMAAGLLADCLWFRIGGRTANGFLKRFRSRLWDKHFPKAAKLVSRSLPQSMLTVKFSLLPSALAPLAAGTTQLPAHKFVYTAVAANLAWTGVFMIGGFTAGEVCLKIIGNSGAAIATVLCCSMLFVPPAIRWISTLGRVAVNSK